MRTAWILLGITLLAAATPAVQGHGGGNAIGLEARETGCGEGQSLCLSTFNLPINTDPGTQVELMVRNFNSSSKAYTIHLAPLEDADPDRRDTPASAALLSVGPVEPGASEEVVFTLPDAARLYAWSDAGDDEAQGMQEEITLRVEDTGSTSPVPLGGALAALALSGAALALARDPRHR